MNEVITVYGILLAVYTYIDSLYTGKIENALAIKPSYHSEDNKKNIKIIKNSLLSQLLPLLILSIVICVILVTYSIQIMQEMKSEGLLHFDIFTSTMLLIVVVFLYWVTRNIYKLVLMIKKLKNVVGDK